uniref:Isoform 3 of Leucine-rich repeat-containing protein 43 n=1 Tax=Homo sapiens TaxID=9606 RepID=Q8N309-3
MECLCAHPPAGLQHLGLGHNKLLGPLESLYVTANHWGRVRLGLGDAVLTAAACVFLLFSELRSICFLVCGSRLLAPCSPGFLTPRRSCSPSRPNLVSLDLGFNDLTDLQSMVTSLRTLRHLRLLVLQGNPLALVPYYRGLTIDSLAQLCVLDDITVSPNEKHLFRGLSLNGDLLAQEAQFVVTIGNIRGVLDTSVLDPEPRPEGPFITYNYYVTYDFVKDEEGEMNESAGVLAEIVKPSPSLELLVEESPEEVVEDVIEDIVEEVTEEVEGSLESEVEESGESELSVISGPSTILQMPRASAEELAKLRLRIDPRLCPSPGTVLFSTAHKPWAEVIPCSYEMQHSLRDLVPLKAFLLAGTTVTIVEEKILSWPVVLPAVDSPLSAKKGKGEKDKKGKEKDRTGKGEKEPAKEWKVLKKKKEPPKELRQDPPILQVLGRGLVILEPLLAGEPLVSTVCNFGVVRTLTSDRLTLARDSKKIKKVAKKEKPKAVIPIYEGDYHPEPLTVEVQIQLNQCRSAEEALRMFAV